MWAFRTLGMSMFLLCTLMWVCRTLAMSMFLLQILTWACKTLTMSVRRMLTCACNIFVVLYFHSQPKSLTNLWHLLVLFLLQGNLILKYRFTEPVNKMFELTFINRHLYRVYSLVWDALIESTLTSSVT